MLVEILQETWDLLKESALYVLFGLAVSGLLRVFLSPSTVARHLGTGRFGPVFKAAFLGIPIPLCSCGVLPAAVSLKKQGANNGATTAFLISTPESGVDSMAVTYALLGPIMTVARPAAAFFSALSAGLLENLFPQKKGREVTIPDLSCPVDACCDGVDCTPEDHRRHHSPGQKVAAGLHYAFTDVWNDMAVWFLAGLLLAGLISALVPEEIMAAYLGGGILSLLIMLAVGIPIYICATASTPIAAALILKGVSPGAALVFLLAGPATNMASLTVLFGVLGRRATAIYLITLALTALISGLLLDGVLLSLGISVQAQIAQSTEWIPLWMEWIAALFILALSVRPVSAALGRRFNRLAPARSTRIPETPPRKENTCTAPT